MSIIDQEIHDRYAVYCGDCMDVMKGLDNESIHLSIYSPPFGTSKGGLYNYSSDSRDLSNCINYEQFMQHYEHHVKEIARITMKGRMSCVHCMDVPSGNSGQDYYIDFPGDIIRLHEKLGFHYCGRHSIWKEPLGVRNRTMAKNLAHKTVVEDSIYASLAGADYLLLFRKHGKNQIPVAHPTGLHKYAGEREMPQELLSFKGFEGKQTQNRFSHWIWRQYASSFWDDIRLDNVLPFREAKEEDDEKHVHPLQLDVIERCVILRSNAGEIVFTPYMGVGSEVYGAVINGRFGIGSELKKSYFNQAKRNMEEAIKVKPEGQEQLELF